MYSVCVCLSNLRYPEREVVLPRRLHHLEELHLVNCTTAFQAYTTHDSREKAFEKFLPVTRRIPCTHRYISGYPGQDESCPLQQSFWNILEGYALKDTPPHDGSSCTNCFLSLYEVWFERKAFGSFTPVMRCTVTFPVTLG